MEKFLDGLLAPEEMADVRRAVEADPELKREADLQRWIDSELDEIFAYDSTRAPKVPHVSVDAPAPIKIETRRRNLRLLALAAAVVLVGVVVRLSLSLWGPGTQVEYAKADEVYNKLVATGFKPAVVCTTDEQFKDFTEKRLGNPLLLASASGVEALGWAYSAPVPGQIVGQRTVLLYTKVDSQNVLVLMDSVDRPAGHPVKVSPPLHVFRQQVGAVVAYEITPLDSPRVVPNLHEAK
jgi:hypothetical protein